MTDTAKNVDEISSELDLLVWSLITSRGVLHSGLTYQAAANCAALADRLDHSGVCVVTDAVADRLRQPAATTEMAIVAGTQEAV